MCDPGRHPPGPETETLYFLVKYLLAVLLVVLDYAGNAHSLKANSENAKKKKMKSVYNAITHCSHCDIILL